jgi:hypothetical protein
MNYVYQVQIYSCSSWNRQRWYKTPHILNWDTTKGEYDLNALAALP